MHNTGSMPAFFILFFGLISWVYFTRFNYTTPLQTAAIFVGEAVLDRGKYVQGFPEYGHFPGTRFLIDIESVQTRVESKSP